MKKIYQMKSHIYHSSERFCLLCLYQVPKRTETNEIIFIFQQYFQCNVLFYLLIKKKPVLIQKP